MFSANMMAGFLLSSRIPPFVRLCSFSAVPFSLILSLSVSAFPLVSAGIRDQNAKSRYDLGEPHA